MKYIISFILIFSSYFPTGLYAQTPVAPELYLLTVDVETGFAVITWLPSASQSFIEYYKVLESQPSIPGQPDVMIEISGEIPIDQTTYEINTGDSQNRSVGYSVVAYNDDGTGPLNVDRSLYNLPDSTIFLQAKFDSCTASISVKWNDYNNWRGNIAAYNIYRRLGAGVYELLGSANEGTKINTMELTGVQPHQLYDLFVEVVHNDGRRSTSNRVAITTNMSEIPEYINADYATISSQNTIDLSFTVDAVPGASTYDLMRSNEFNGTYTLVNSFELPGTVVHFTDNIPFESGIYYYKLEVVNNCGIASTISNIANNIILDGTLNNLDVSLQWNEYKDWLGGIENYKIIRKLGTENPLIDTFTVTGSASFNQDISQFVNYENPLPGFVCYSVIATENTNIYGVKGKSKSNRVCFAIKPDVRFPNAFVPNDSEPVNQVFEPVFSFLPEHYDLIIYNRQGSKIWEGSEAWDGKIGGKYVPEGVYLFYVRVYMHSSNVFEYNGKVTILYR